MLSDQLAISATFSVYLALVLIIGIYAARRTENASDYFLGGRTLGPWPTALSAGASDMSGWLLLGLPGYAYTAGIEAFWLAGGLLIGTYCNWKWVAKRLRTYSVLAKDSLTIPEYFANRFSGNTQILRLLSASFILLFYLFYTSAGLVAGGKLFASVFGMDYQLAVILGASCVMIYTFIGGYLAVSWTDLIQGLLMAAALVLVPITALQFVGGPHETFQALRINNPELLTLWNDAKGAPLSAIAIISLLSWGLGYFGQPHILARFKAIRSNSDIPTARRIAMTWTIISMLGALAVGLIGHAYIDSFLSGIIDDPEKIFIVLVNALFSPLVGGILLAAVLAAIMSTADSQLLVSSASFTEDIYRLLRKQANPKELMLVARVAVVVISLIALVLALNPEGSVLGLIGYAWAGFGAAFGPALLFSLYWKKMNQLGALAGVFAGGITVIIWKQLDGGLFDLYELVPGFAIACAAIILVSLITAKPDKRVTEDFEAFEKKLTEHAG